jgi:hypothetical protein
MGSSRRVSRASMPSSGPRSRNGRSHTLHRNCIRLLPLQSISSPTYARSLLPAPAQRHTFQKCLVRLCFGPSSITTLSSHWVASYLERSSFSARQHQSRHNHRITTITELYIRELKIHQLRKSPQINSFQMNSSLELSGQLLSIISTTF